MDGVKDGAPRFGRNVCHIYQSINDRRRMSIFKPYLPHASILFRSHVPGAVAQHHDVCAQQLLGLVTNRSLP